MPDQLRQSEQFFARLSGRISEPDLDEVRTAYLFAKYGHRNQKRDGGERYFNHPRAVACIIFDELRIYDAKIIVTALLHDILEDSYLLSERTLRVNFGNQVSWWIRVLTKQDGVPYLERIREQAIWQAVLVKLADRLHNVRSLKTCKPEKIRKQVEETKSFYLPLADFLQEIIPASYRPKAETLKKNILLALAEYEA